MRIKKITVDNYRFFNNFTLDFSSGVDNVFQTIGIYGLNGSGKTTLLKLFRDFIETIRNYFYFLNNAKVDSKQRSFMLLYSVDKVLEKLDVKYKKMKLQLVISNDREEDVVIEYHNANLKINGKLIQRYLDVKKQVIVFPNLLKQFDNFIFYPSIAQQFSDFFRPSGSANNTPDPADSFIREIFPFLFNERVHLYDHVKTQYSPQFMNKFEKAYTDYISNGCDNIFSQFKKYLEDHNMLTGKSIKSVKDGIMWFGINNEKELIPFYDLSAGETHLITRILAIMSKTITDGVILFDEPETSFHFEWQENFVNWIREIPGCKNNQIIFASHSEDLANSCDKFVHLTFSPEEYKLHIA
ncbi:MAG: AAA family ATPase [Bacteriovoracaceae bacterium]|nr:AAA family ATPase [Bacteriovoracaceae bacterium]